MKRSVLVAVMVAVALGLSAAAGPYLGAQWWVDPQGTSESILFIGGGFASSPACLVPGTGAWSGELSLWLPGEAPLSGVFSVNACLNYLAETVGTFIVAPYAGIGLFGYKEDATLTFGEPHFEGGVRFVLDLFVVDLGIVAGDGYWLWNVGIGIGKLF